MAYVDQQFEEEEESGGPSVPGSGAGVNAAAGASAGGGPSQSTKKTPGRFADLSEYLRVNQGQDFGTKLAGKVGEDVQKGQQTLDTAQNEFKSRADASTVRDTAGLASQVASNPESVDVNEFAKLRDASYRGPSSLADTPDLYNQVQGNAGAAVGKANASKSEGGRFALLDNYFGKPTYSQGQKSLDNLLVQNDPKSQQAFDQMRANAQALQGNVNQAGVDLGNYGAGARATTEGTRQAARGAIGIDDSGAATGTGALGAQNQAIQEQYQSRLSKQQADKAALEQAFQSGDYRGLSPELRQMLGLDGVQSLYGANPSDYLSSVSGLTQQQTATPEQAARLRVLNQLGGLDSSGWEEGNVGAYDTESLLGFNSEGFRNNVGNQQQAYQQALSSPVILSSPTALDFPAEGDNISAAADPAIIQKLKTGAVSTQESINLLNQLLANTMANKPQRKAAIQAELAKQQQKLQQIGSNYGQNQQFQW